MPEMVEEPDSRLGRIAQRMLQHLEHDPENPADDIQGIVLLLGPSGDANAALAGYDDPADALAAVLSFAQAIAESNDLPFAVMEVSAGPGEAGVTGGGGG